MLAQRVGKLGRSQLPQKLGVYDPWHHSLGQDESQALW